MADGLDLNFFEVNIIFNVRFAQFLSDNLHHLNKKESDS